MKIIKEYNENLKLLKEHMDFDYDRDILEKEKGKSGKFVMRGILQKADTLNQNSRIYPRHILERELNNYQKFIRERRALGELDHPDSSVVELKNVSHLVTEAYMDADGTVYGTLEILDTPAGKIAKSLAEANVKFGISSRGIGETSSEDDHEIVNNYNLIGWDLVAEPSVATALLVKEARFIKPQEMKEINDFFKKSDRVDRILNEILRKDK